MENQETPNIFRRFWNYNLRKYHGDQTENQFKQETHDTSETRILDIQRAENAKRAALIQRAQQLCAGEKARNDAVLERLGLPVQVPLPSPQPPVGPRGCVKSSARGKRISPLLEGCRLDIEDIDRNQSPDSFIEKDDRYNSPTSSKGSVYSLSSRDSRTPPDLKDSALVEVGNFTPVPPPPRAVPPLRRRLSRLPVPSAKVIGADKEVADGYRLQTARDKVDAILEKLEHIQKKNSMLRPLPPAATKRTPATTTLAPTPPKTTPPKTRGPRPATLRPAKPDNKALRKTASNRRLQPANDKKVELQPLSNPTEKLSLSFKLLDSDDWMKKIEGLKIMQALAQHHLKTMKTKLHEVCLVLIEEVANLRSAVACAAMNTLADLYIHLDKTMDPEVEGTGRALLLKLAQTTNTFIHQQVNLALDAMVQNCSPSRIVSALLNTGLSHRCVAVRASMAEHLHQVADSLEAAHILTAGRTFTERFLIAVSKMSVDGAPEVRHHGQMILQDLALHPDFLQLWIKIVPEKERRPLDKILRKARK